jgi:hypothetical protein
VSAPESLLTASVYLAHMGLVLWLFRRAEDDVLAAILGGSMLASWGVGALVGEIARIAAMILLDVALIMAVKQWTYGRRALAVAGISVLAILARAAFMPIQAGSAHVVNPYVDHWIYAAAVNLAFVLQCLVAGGQFDVIGRRFADRFPRLHGGLARVLAHGGQ